MVAPLAGAWIEIETSKIEVDGTVVAPLAGAWIEISRRGGNVNAESSSLPLRERGLK